MTRIGANWRARTRLTLWYVGLLGAILLFLGALGYWAIGQELHADFDETLRSNAAAVSTEVDSSEGHLHFDAEMNPDTHLPVVAAGLDLVRIWDHVHRQVYRQEPVSGVPPADTAQLDQALAGHDGYARTSAADGGEVRLYTMPLRAGSKVIGVLQVGRSKAQIDAILSRLQLLGGAGLLIALALAWAGGYLLAGRALAPVDRITRTAERISAEDLSQRLALPLPDDELGRLARAFDGMIARLDHAFQRQRRFTADAAHELRTPLTTIRAQADVALARPREPAYYATVIAGMREEAERLRNLTESLLLLARAEGGDALELAPVDLAEVLADAAERSTPRARERGIHFSVTLAEVPPIRGDATWLLHLVLNLLDNALRHTPPNGRVSLALATAPDGAIITVADTGEGIAAKHLPHIFERFYRADPGRGRAAGGDGLGLAICDRIAVAHGARLEVQSTPGHGTTFTLPLSAV